MGSTQIKHNSLVEWLEERRDNCLRIAKTKVGDDRLGWLEDASYFEVSALAAKFIAEASGDQSDNHPLRLYIALRLLRAWNHGTAGFSADVVATVNDWFDTGRKGPIPWIDNPFFAEWADSNGYANIEGYVGFRLRLDLSRGYR
jgi:hypothetical protein